MMGFGSGLGYGLGGWLMMFGAMALVVGLILLAVWAVNRVGGSTGASAPIQTVPPAAPPAQDAMEVLRLRLAKGEVTPEEFANIKQALETGR